MNSYGVTYEITNEGLASIKVGSTLVGRGGLYLWDGAKFHDKASSSISPYEEVLARNKSDSNISFYKKVQGTISNRNTLSDSTNVVIIEHTHANQIKATYTYTFNEPDIDVEVKIENNSKDKQITCPTIGGLFFTFNSNPDGYFFNYQESTAGNKLHPSDKVPFYASHIYDSSYGVGVNFNYKYINYIENLINFDYGDGDDSEQYKVLELYCNKSILPGASYLIKFQIRVSTTLTYQHLLENYKNDFLENFPSLNYNINSRKWISGVIVNDGPSSISPSNPYGYKSNRRLDDYTNTSEFANEILNSMLYLGKGLVIYDLAGYNTTGGMYRSEFNVFPLETEDNLGVFFLNFNSLPGISLGFGCLTELKYYNTLTGYNESSLNTPISITYGPTQIAGSHIRIINKRIVKLIEKFFTLVYSPNSGDSLNCYTAAIYVRTFFGADVSIYFGKYFDLLIPYVGLHTFVDYTTEYIPRTPLKFIEIMKWILGDFEIYGEKGSGTFPVDDSFYTYLFEHKMSFWANDESQYAEVNEVQPNYIDTTTGLFNLLATSLLTINTDASTTPTTAHITLKDGLNAVKIFSGNQPKEEGNYFLYVRRNGGTAVKILMHRYISKIINASPGETLSFGTSDGRELQIAGMVVPTSLSLSGAEAETITPDIAGPPLWTPQNAHVILPSRNMSISLSYGAGAPKAIFMSEFDGLNWSYPKLIKLMPNTLIHVRCTYSLIAFANYDGSDIDLILPTGSEIVEQSNSMTFGIVKTGTTRNVTAGSESDLRTKLSEAVAGDEVVLPAGTYTLTVAISQAIFVANGSTGSGIIVRGETGDADDVIIVPFAGSNRFNIDTPTATNELLFKDLTFSMNGIASSGITVGPGKFRFENVKFLGTQTDNDALFTFRTSGSGAIDLKCLFCEFSDGNGDNINGSGNNTIHDVNSTVQFIGCTCENAGSGSDNYQCIASTNGLNYEIYGGTWSDARVNVILNSNAIGYLFFTTVSNGARKCGISTVNMFCVNYISDRLDGVDAISLDAADNSYMIGCYVNKYAASFMKAIGTFGSVDIGLYEGNVFDMITTASSSRTIFAQVGGSTFRFNLIIGSAEALRVSSYSSGNSNPVTIYNNSIVGATTAFYLDDATLVSNLVNNASSASTNGLFVTVGNKSRVVGSYNVLDPSITNYTSGTQDVTNQDAALTNFYYAPTQGGNCDNTGTPLIYDWVGGLDPFGFTARHKSTTAAKGARENPFIYPGAELHPDIWIV